MEKIRVVKATVFGHDSAQIGTIYVPIEAVAYYEKQPSGSGYKVVFKEGYTLPKSDKAKSIQAYVGEAIFQVIQLGGNI